jgi:prepilin-type N-terminal cleavage/methylation domain-containing protein
MRKKKFTAQGGFTLIELMIATVLGAIVILGVSVMLADGQRGWQTMYARIQSDVVTDSYAARRTFDAIMRKASKKKVLSDDTGSWIEVYYYADADSTSADRYARFYVADGDLNLEYGKLNPKETVTVQTICSNVSNCVFETTGYSAQMILSLDNGSQAIDVVSSAVLHNE